MRKHRNWIWDYLQYTKPMEARTSYHTWSGLSAIAAVLRRRVWVDIGFKIFPNMYVVLVGPSGRTRKTSAVNVAVDLLQDIPEVVLSADSTTRQSLIRTIKDAEETVKCAGGKEYKHSSVTIISKELSVFLGSGDHDLLSLLTDLYDTPRKWEYRLKNPSGNPPRTTDLIENCWLNMLAASTPTWLVGSIPLTAIGGGFTSRILFVVEESIRYKRTFPRLSMKTRETLLDDLVIMSKSFGEVSLTSNATSVYDNWYQNENVSDNPDPRFLGYSERRHVHLLKVALILSMSDSTAEGKIHTRHINQAKELLNSIEMNMTSAFGAAGRSPIAADIDTVLSAIKMSGGYIDRDSLIAAIAMDVHPRELDIVTDTLERMGSIKIKPDVANGKIYYEYVKGG